VEGIRNEAGNNSGSDTTQLKCYVYHLKKIPPIVKELQKKQETQQQKKQQDGNAEASSPKPLILARWSEIKI
jgi:hypothetical protein